MHEKFAEHQSRTRIEYPYMPEEGTILYVNASNKYMQLAKEFARRYSLDKTMPNTSVIVKDDEVIGIGANGSNYHELNGCVRVQRGIPTGQGYDLCEGCHPKNHGEQKALADARALTGENRFDGAKIYLWGHWWCCKPCWDAMLASGIDTVYLLDDSEVLFNREDPGNIIGRHFDDET